MSDKNFVNYHILISHNSSCLNRDDMGMQKTAVFGGTRRVRISSQSLKREMRKPRLEAHVNSYWKQHFGEPSIRTRDLTKLNEKFIVELSDEFEPAFINEAIDRFVKTTKSIASEGEQDAIEEGAESLETEVTKKVSKKIAVAPWVINEIREICRVIKAVKDEGLAEDELKKINEAFDKQKKKKKSREELIDEAIGKKIEKQLKEKSDVMATALASAVDIALFGRMATSGLMTSVDGARQGAGIEKVIADGDHHINGTGFDQLFPNVFFTVSGITGGGSHDKAGSTGGF